MNIQKIMEWYYGVSGNQVQELSPTRDVFQARLDGFLRALLAKFGDQGDIMLQVAVIGELGNNSFDHNLGRWQDVQGCVFDSDLSKHKIKIVIADRGQGIFSSLKRVDPSLKDPQTALETAFSKILSGRFPENRGNGLKFVRQSINDHPKRGLCCLSNGGKFHCGTKGPELLGESQDLAKNLSGPAKGTFTLFEWGVP